MKHTEPLESFEACASTGHRSVPYPGLPRPRGPGSRSPQPRYSDRSAGQERILASQPLSAADWQQTFDTWHDDFFSGADHACSLELPDGRSIWLFGDTERGRMTADGGRAADDWFVRSSFLLYGHGHLRVVYGADGGAVLPNGPEGIITWPHGVAVDRGVLHVFGTRVRVTGRSALAFDVLDGTLVSYGLPAGLDPFLIAQQSLPDCRGLRWGAAVTTADGHLYVYATLHSGERWVFGNDVYVARVRLGHLRDLALWEYWNGCAWSPYARDAHVVLDGRNGPGSAMSIHRRADGAWVLLSKQHDVFGQYISTWTAPEPQGPWSLSNPALAPAPSFAGNQRFTYNAFAHPEISLASGALLVTVSRNSMSPVELRQDANLYMPQFLEVPTADIGGQLSPARWL